MHAAHLPDIYRNSLVDKGGLHLAELGTHIVLVAPGSLLCGVARMPPLRTGVVQSELHRVIEVDGKHQAVVGLILRKHEALHRNVNIGHVGRNAEITVRIVPARGTHRIHERLVPLVHHGILPAAVLAVVPPSPTAVVNLVHRLEREEIPLVPEPDSNLRPYCL